MILARYGEIALKGGNRVVFEKNALSRIILKQVSGKFLDGFLLTLTKMQYNICRMFLE